MIFRYLTLTVIVFSVLAATALDAAAQGAPQPDPKNQLSTLEGMLKRHPKYLFKYYIAGFADGQECALFGEDKLRNIKPGSWIHVEGKLGTKFSPGSTKQNLSPFPRTWFIYMDVEKVEVLREPEEKGAGQGGKGQ